MRKTKGNTPRKVPPVPVISNASTESTAAVMRSQHGKNDNALGNGTNRNCHHVEDKGDNDEDSIDIGACSLCHCALDYSDRAAFFKADREEDYKQDQDKDDETEEFFFRPTDPYLPTDLYDKSNALLYCDDCDRMFHQKCHFVPVTVLPRGKWSCLVCQSVRNMTTKKATPASSKGRGKRKGAASADGESQTKTGGEEWSSIVKNVDMIFRSPPVPAAKVWENKWEFAVRRLKALEWSTELTKRLKQASSTQGTNYRQAYTALSTLTTIKRNRNHHFASGRTPSQEVAQTLVKLYGARLNWREMCFGLDSIRRATNDKWHLLHQFVEDSKCAAEFIQRVLFPFGTNFDRRVEPRTAEMAQAMKEQNTPHSLPKEVLLWENNGGAPNKSRNKKSNNKDKQQPQSPRNKKKTLTHSPRRGKAGVNHRAQSDNDDNSGVSLDNLRCCVCFGCTSTDNNDLVLCDSAGCYRSYHMKCLHPEMIEADLDNDDDWFCPLCTTLSKTMLDIQTQFMGDEWEEERLECAYAKSNSRSRNDARDHQDDHEVDSLKSWDEPDEVFPTAERDFAAAMLMKQGKRTKATDDLVARILGVEQLSDHDDDDEEEDEHFDLEAFEKERKQEYTERRKVGDSSDDKDEDEDASGGEDGSDGSHSSQATLVEMSSVELEIGRGELAALSGAESSSEDDDDEGEGEGSSSKYTVRRSRRLQNDPPKPRKRESRTAEATERVDEMGELDEANILVGKRGRKPVDYIRLNEAIFGGVDDKELDDADDFPLPRTKCTKKTEDSNDEHDNDGDDEAGEEEGSVNVDNASAEAESGHGSKTADFSVDASTESPTNSSAGTRSLGRKEKPQKLVVEDGRKKNRHNGVVSASKKRANKPEAQPSPVHPFARLNGVAFTSRARRRLPDVATTEKTRGRNQNGENGKSKRRRTRKSGE